MKNELSEHSLLVGVGKKELKYAIVPLNFVLSKENRMKKNLKSIFPILLTAFSFYCIYKIIDTVYFKDSYNKTISELLLGIKKPQSDSPLYQGLLKQFEGKMSQLAKSLPENAPTANEATTNAPTKNSPNPIFVFPFQQVDDNGEWIEYGGEPGEKVNYSKISFCNNDFEERYKMDLKEAKKDSIDKRKKEEEGKKKYIDAYNNQTDPTESYVFNFFLNGIINNSKTSIKYNDFSERTWSFFFKEEKIDNLKIGRVYIATNNTYSVYPKFSNVIILDPVTRDWWKAAYPPLASQATSTENSKSKETANNSKTPTPTMIPKEEVILSPPKSEDIRLYNELSSGDSGLTKPYLDYQKIRGDADFIRTLWFKFEKYDKKFVVCVDLRLASVSTLQNESLGNYLTFLCVSILGLFIFVFFNYPLFQSESTISLYKFERIRDVYSVKNHSKTGVLKVELQFSARNIQTNQKTLLGSIGSIFKWFGLTFENSQTKTKEQSAEIKTIYSREFPVSIAGLSDPVSKQTEFWAVYQTNQMQFAVATFQVSWNANAVKPECKVLYHDSNYTSAFSEKTLGDILVKYLQGSDQSSFIHDTNLQIGSENEIVTQLKTSNFLKKIMLNSNAYNERFIHLEEVLPYIFELLNQQNNMNLKIRATASIEFLEFIHSKGKLGKIFNENSSTQRVIIESNTKTVTSFVQTLDQAIVSELRTSESDPGVVPYNQEFEGFFKYRDFCIIEFIKSNPDVNLTLVLGSKIEGATFTNKGWISWRKADIDFYSELFEYFNEKQSDKLSKHLPPQQAVSQ